MGWPSGSSCPDFSDTFVELRHRRNSISFAKAKALLSLLGALVPTVVPFTAVGQDARPTTAQDAADTHLAIEVRRALGLPAEHYVLTCDPPSGTVRDPAGTCRRIADLAARQTRWFWGGSSLTRPGTDSTALCTQVYGGPEVASIRGRFLGAPVDARLTREDGCTMSSFDATMELLGIP